MLDQNWGISSLSNAILRPRRTMNVGGHSFEAYEPLLIFDEADIMLTTQASRSSVARGGKENSSLVHWSRIEDIQVGLSKGKLSDIGLSLLTNAIAVEYISGAAYYVSTSELKQLDSSGQCELTNIPHISGNYKMFAYDVSNGTEMEKKTINVVLDNTIEVTNAANALVKIFYYYDYNGAVKEIILQQSYFEGYFQLEGKTTIVDDNGEKRSLFVIFPKIAIINEVAFELTSSKTPTMANFQFEALTDTYLGNKTALYYVVLDDVID